MTTARCPYYGSCGGCTAQHIPYEEQLAQKKQALLALFPDVDIQVLTGQPYGYRNRMDFVFHPMGLGLRARGDWKHIIDVEECSIADPVINLLLKEVRALGVGDVFHVRKKSGTFRYAVIRTSGDESSVSFVLNSESPRIAPALETIQRFAKTTTADHVMVAYVPPSTDTSVSDDTLVIKGSEVLTTRIADTLLRFPIQGFFQNNHAMNQVMHDHVSGIIQQYATKDMHLLDLYGGVGNFGIAHATAFSGLTIVESAGPGITCAEANIKENRLARAQAIALDAKQLQKVRLPQPLFVITDPPRSGMHSKTIATLNSLRPAVLVYISCNPKQLQRELRQFPDYKLKSLALCDLFPQTPHMEAIAELARKPPAT